MLKSIVIETHSFATQIVVPMNDDTSPEAKRRRRMEHGELLCLRNKAAQLQQEKEVLGRWAGGRRVCAEQPGGNCMCVQKNDFAKRPKRNGDYVTNTR
jgi:hypothetical protein